MVFYFTSKSGTVMYMGRDKYENEDLIKHSLPHDVWFHVDNLSSAQAPDAAATNRSTEYCCRTRVPLGGAEGAAKADGVR